jgi:hypothetical protein
VRHRKAGDKTLKSWPQLPIEMLKTAADSCLGGRN